MKVLVLDGETRSALAVVRSLGAKRHTVIVASERRRTISSSSTFCSMALHCPSPTEKPDEFAQWIKRTANEMRPDVLLPVTDASLGLVLEYEEEIRSRVVLPFVSRNTYQTVSDKFQLGKIANELGVPWPKSVYIPPALERRDDVLEQIRSFPYPAALKPAQSVTRLLRELKKRATEYPENADQVFRTINEDEKIPFLLQEKVEGRGVGVFALCVNGEILTWFAHERILEKPPTGGVSVLSESLAMDRAPVEHAKKLLEHLRWTGVAMVEFKRTAAGEHSLMEINPRFWGSLQLAVDCGRDFPAYLVQLSACKTEGDLEALRAKLKALPPYPQRHRLRWVLGTLDHALTRMRREGRAGTVAVLARNALRLREKGYITTHETYRSGDTRPFFVELEEWFQRR